MFVHDDTTHFYGRWVTSSTRSSSRYRDPNVSEQRSATHSLLYPTTPSLFPTPFSQGASWAPSGLNDEIFATSTPSVGAPPVEEDPHRERLMRFMNAPLQQSPQPMPLQRNPLPALQRQPQPQHLAEKSPGVLMHELLADLDPVSIHELYCLFVRPGVRLAGAEHELHNALDIRASTSPSSERDEMSVAVSEDSPGLLMDVQRTSPRSTLTTSSALPALVGARIVTEVEDHFMDYPSAPLVTVSCQEQPPPLNEMELRRRIVLEEHERQARLDVIQFEVRQRAIAKHLSAS